MKKKFLKTLLRKIGFSIRESKEEIENFYEKSDPWGYKTNPSDKFRKQRILKVLNEFLEKSGRQKFKRTLDLGCGEGWITEDLPAEEIIGIDISSQAIERTKKSASKAQYYSLDLNEILIKDLLIGNFDLIVATGIFYKDYIKPKVVEKIIDYLEPGGILLSCHIKQWKIFRPKLSKLYQEEFPYREYDEELILYQK